MFEESKGFGVRKFDGNLSENFLFDRSALARD